MRHLFVLPVILCGLTLTSCSRDDEPSASARQAGREAYRASREAKADARKAAEDLRHAGKNFRDGWEEAKHQDPHPRRDVTDR